MVDNRAVVDDRVVVDDRAVVDDRVMDGADILNAVTDSEGDFIHRAGLYIFELTTKTRSDMGHCKK